MMVVGFVPRVSVSSILARERLLLPGESTVVSENVRRMLKTGERTRYSAILNEAPKPSPSWSAPEKIPTTNTGEFENRPVSFKSLLQIRTQ